jgi:Tfp pilus assembly protein PilF
MFRKGVSVELKDLISGAQGAMDQGDYRLAIAASNHALVGYDACLAAHRLLGEAYLERGDQQSAITHFERAILIDPLNVVARLGLGVAAEETKRYEDAYAHYLHAWEINPALDQVRDELVRLRGLLNVEDRLHPTRAGLAGIHARCGQFARAIAEWRAVLSVEPESRRARTSLAELLWRQADDAGAAAAAREALRGSPENARALAILADVERRRNGSYSADITQRYASVDPTGEVLEYLRHWRSDADLDALIPDSILIDNFDFDSNRSRHTSGLSRKSITGTLAASQMAAPDLWDTLVKDLATDVPHRFGETLATGVEPFKWADGPPPHGSIAEIPATPESNDDDLGDVFPMIQNSEDQAEVLHASQSVPALDADAMSQSPASSGAAPAAAEMFPEAVLDQPERAPNSVEAAAAFDEFETDLVPFSLDEITGVVSPAARELDESMLSDSFGELPVPIAGEPVAMPVEVNAEPKVADYVDPFVAEDGRIDLTAGWDTLDHELEAATPNGSGDGFDSLVAELDVDGIIPFNAEVESPDEDAWAPFSEVDFTVPTADAAAISDDVAGIDLSLPDATGEAIELADLEAFDVNSFVEPQPAPNLGQEIMAGIPLPQPSGYTELLRNVDEESLPAPAFGDDVDPFSNPDSSGSPLAFDELIEVTSTDGTGPLESQSNESSMGSELDFANTDLAAAMPGADIGEIDPDLEGVEPFDSSSFAEATVTDDDDIPAIVAMETPVYLAPEPESALPDMAPLADVGDLAPFAFADGPVDDPGGVAVDFTEMDGVPDVFAVESPGADLFAVADSEPLTAETPEIDIGSEAFETDSSEEMAAEQEDMVLADDVADLQAAEMTEQATDGGDDSGPIEHVRSVAWPQFMSQTSMLMDRTLESEGLFARIAAQKDALIEMGVVAGGKRLSMQPTHSGGAPIIVAEPPVEVAPRGRIEATEQVRMDLMAMRVRLIEDDDSAREIAEMLEEAIEHGLQTPLALRVLGEAYLKLGMVERAAAQFRQAMLTRRGA